MASSSKDEDKKISDQLEQETSLNVDIEVGGSTSEVNGKLCDETNSKNENETGDGKEAGDDKEAGAEEEKEEVDPDALTKHQVIGAVAFLIAFSLSFATSFLLTNAASRSLDANFTDSNYTCSIANMIVDPVNITCYGSSTETQCIRVSLNCDGFNDTKLLYEYYHSYYRKAGSDNYDPMECWCQLCSAIRCSPPDISTELEDGSKVKYPHSFLRSCCSVNDTSETYNETASTYTENTPELDMYDNIQWRSYDGFYYDLNKPDAMFYKRTKPGTNNIFMSHVVAYCILIIPNVIMGVVITSLLLLFLCDKISAKEIYRPVTPISPLHMEVNGKWYIKDVAPEKPQLNAFEKLRASKAEG